MAGYVVYGNTIYQKLNPNEIRLIRVSRGSDDTVPLLIAWKVVDLYSKETPYTTISYTWGSKEDEVTLVLEKGELSIPRNGYGALELLCDHAPARQTEWCWIDCLCINQGDDEEKREQIKIMKDIFKLSSHCIVWLGPRVTTGNLESRNGPSPIDTDRGMNLLHKLARQRPILVDARNQGNGKRGTPGELESDNRWKDLEFLLRLPWWRRVWTLQEFILPKIVTLWCGLKHISRERLCTATHAIWICKPDHLLDHKSWQPLWDRRRVLQHFTQKPSGTISSLIALMAYNCSNEVTDPVDRIWGVLGIVTDDKDLKLVRKLDYCVGTRSTFTSLVKGWIQAHQCLDIICYASVFTGGAKTYEERKLPSWVPDWSVPTRLFVVPLMVSQGDNLAPVWSLTGSERRLRFTASGDNSRPRYKFFNDGLRLSCTGFLVDHVDGLTALDDPKYPMMQSRLQSEQPMNEPATNGSSTVTSSMLDTVIRCLVLDRGDRYLSKPALIENFKEEFLHVALGAQAETGTPEESLQRWFCQNRDFRIQGVRLEDLCRTPGPQGPPKQVSGDQKTFASNFSDRHIVGLRLMTTMTGNVGMGGRDARPGYAICILLGCNVPVVLKPRSNGSYQLVGECYLEGYMSGEILREVRVLETKDFVLV
ncbi:heterokaryon incompatibility protein-domain-containing protein [Xylariaceae sp. FL1651]|nr:heterokaryon incompatibility protein-domain-containing protein [Xylariaceae sp. FL1651]